jgi:predicted phage terminase large subunit-like protein
MGLAFSPRQIEAATVLSGQNRYSCLVGGTRSGKTFLIVRAIALRALKAPNSRHAILRFRGNAARASISLDTLPTVMRVCFPGEVATEKRQDGYFELANGSQIWVGGLDDKDRVEKILGLEFVTIFLNEASQIPYSSALIAFTRLAQVCPEICQRGYVDLNPVGKTHWTNQLFGEKCDPISKQVLANGEDYRRAFLNPVDNAHNLAPEFIASLKALPAKARKRFYEGAYIDEVEGALWTYAQLEADRVNAQPLNWRRKIVAVDPPATSGEDADECGIVVAGKCADGKAYVIADATSQGETPNQWARRAIRAYYDHECDLLVAEVNNGGEMVEAVIRHADPKVNFKSVRATHGKITRAEPVSALYEQHKVHHIGTFARLEDQMCVMTNDFDPDSAGFSPDRVDALVWAMTELMLGRASEPGIRRL